MGVIYQSVNMPVFVKIPEHTNRILDIGCGGGTLGEALKQRAKCHITGITYSEEEAIIARHILDEVIVKDLTSLDTNTLPIFDMIICSHVLEHLYHPEKLLINLKANLVKGGKFIIALPNILHWRQRLVFLRGDFKYEDTGLLDSTHYRFYDWETSLDLVQRAGLKVISHEAEGYFPLSRKLFPFAASDIDAFFLSADSKVKCTHPSTNSRLRCNPPGKNLQRGP
jgi:predicted TPR repeat methyltransferase